MLITDSPELTHLPEDQAPSAESLSAPSQSKMVHLKWIPISETVQRGTGSKVIHLFLHDRDNWMDIMLVRHLLVDHPFAAGFGQTCKAWRSLADSLSNCKDPDGKLVYGVHGIGEKAAKKRFEELMAFMKGCINHVPFESGTDDAAEGTELVAGLEDLLEIVSGLENEKCVTTSQTAARKCEDRARAEALRNASLGNLTVADKELIKKNKVVELESSSAKKQLANNSPAEMYRILGSSAERLKQRMKMKAQRELHKENRKNRRLELKAENAKQQHEIELQKLEHARQQQAIELQKLELQTRASEALFAIIQERQNQGNH